MPLAVFAGQGEKEEEESLKSCGVVRWTPGAPQELTGRGPLSPLVSMDDLPLGPKIISDFLLFPEHLSFSCVFCSRCPAIQACFDCFLYWCSLGRFLLSPVLSGWPGFPQNNPLSVPRNIKAIIFYHANAKVLANHSFPKCLCVVVF